MKSRKPDASKLTSLSLMALMCTISPIAVREAAAQYQPGDACTAAETGFFVRAADDVPGPAIEGHNFIFCDGATWRSFLQYNDASSAVFMRAPDSAPGDILFNNSHWSLWLDEANDQFELKARKSDGTIINSTVGLGGGGLWTDNTTHITYTGSAAHFINTGQTLPAGFDAPGTRMFFYPDKQAFRGGEIVAGFGDDAWQEANIGTHSFAWGLNNEAAGNFSVAMGRYVTAGEDDIALGYGATATGLMSSVSAGHNTDATGRTSVAMGRGSDSSGDASVAMGYYSESSGKGSFAVGYFAGAHGKASTAMGSASASGRYSVALGLNPTASGDYSFAVGALSRASGDGSFALGNNVFAGDGLFVSNDWILGSANPAVGEVSFAFGLQTATQTSPKPMITGQRSAVFFFDSNVANANQNYDFTATDRLGLVGGQLQIGETQAQGAAAGCIQFNEATDQMEWSHDCTTYNVFGTGGGGLWTDNTTHITRESAHIIDAGQALPATLDDDGTRMFFYPDKEAFRGGEITGGNDAWQEANIGTHSFAWGLNSEASGNFSVALGNSMASGNYSSATGFSLASGYMSSAMGSSTASNNFATAMGLSLASRNYATAMGFSTASGNYATAMGLSTASGNYATTSGFRTVASGDKSLAMGHDVSAGSGTPLDGSGSSSMAFGLQTSAPGISPIVTGDRSAVFFFDGDVLNANSTYDFTASDRLGLVGGQLQIGETQAQGAAAGCIQFNEATDQMEWSHDCTTYNAFSNAAGLWTDNTTHITRENFNIIDAGQTLPAGFDADGSRAFYYPDKEAFRGGEITLGRDSWQEANIGTHSFAWGLNTEASGNFSVALGNSEALGILSTSTGWGRASGYLSFATGASNATGYGSAAFGASGASGRYSFSQGYSGASGGRSAAFNVSSASGRYSFSTGNTFASGRYSSSFGEGVIAGSGTAGDGTGDNSMAFGMQPGITNNIDLPVVSANGAAVFFFDGGVDDANDLYDFTATDRLGLVGGQLQIGETQAQGAAAGCIQFNEATDQMEWSHDCTTYNAFSNAAGLWTDNTTHVTQADSNAHLIKTGQTLPAVLDDDGTRMFFYPDKEAFRGGEITGGNDAWQEANIGTHSFAWGQNTEAAGNFSVAMGSGSTASGFVSTAMGTTSGATGDYSVAIGWLANASGTGATALGYSSAVGNQSISIGYGNSATGGRSVSLGYSTHARGAFSAAMGGNTYATGVRSTAMGSFVAAGSGTAGDGAGDDSMAFGLIAQGIFPGADRPQVTGDRSAVFFFDQNTADSLDNYDFTATDRLGLVGGQLQIGETQLQGAAAGCIQFNEATDQMEWSHDCTTYNAFSNAAGLWTDNTTHVTQADSNVHLIKTGQALPATLDDDGTRMFFYPDKQAFRGGRITGGNDAWQDANIGNYSFAWGRNAEASGAYSLAMGSGNSATDFYSVAMGGFNTQVTGQSSFGFGYGHVVSSMASVAMGYNHTVTGYASTAFGGRNRPGSNYSTALGHANVVTGDTGFAVGNLVQVGSGTAGDGAGDNSMAFGLQSIGSFILPRPTVTGDRSAVFFFDGNVADSNANYDFTASDRLGLVGGLLQIGERQDQGAAAGCIQFNEATDQMEWSHDCTTYNAFSNAAGLWTDNTTHITRENFNIIDAGQTLPAGFDADGSRAFYYTDKQAFRGGEITGGNDAWQEANIGTHSFAWGQNVEAAGNFSVAMGSGSTATATRSIALSGGDASGVDSMAMGAFSSATARGSVALGGAGSFGSYSFSSGFGVANTRYSVAMGDSTATGNYAVAMGESTANGNYSTALGNSQASDRFSTAMGGSAATGYASSSLGLNITASGDSSIALGRQVVAGSGTAGDGAGDGAFAFGLQTAAQATEPTVTGDRTAAFIFDGGVVDANSTVDITADDALIVYGGRVGIGMTTTPDVALDVIGDIEYTGILIDMSDRRLKENIEELTTGQLQKIIELQAVSFNMKDDADKKMEFGLIAQDVLKVYPELVYENSDGMLSVNYVGLIAPMAEAMEEQFDKIKEQEAKIETQNLVIQSQKSRMDLLEEKLRALEEKIQTGATVHGFMLALLTLGF